MARPTSPPSGDIVLANARVHRVPGDPAPVEGIAIRDGEIVAVGSLAAVRAAVPGARELNLGGRTVTPAFVDSHTHYHRAAVLAHLYLDFAALAPVTVDDVLGHVRRRAAELPPGTWIQGDTLSAGRLAEGRLPGRRELDAAAPEHPVLLRGIGKHVVAANTQALAIAGIDRETDDPPGGRIERDDQGDPTGILHERAKLRLDTSDPATVVPEPTREERLAALRAGTRALHALGVTTIHEMVRLAPEADDWAALRAAGDLDVRVRLFYRVHEATISLDWLEGLGIRRGLGDDWLRVEGAKISVDGFCVVRNAAVYEPYLGEPDNLGIFRIEPAELCSLVARANRQGLGIAVHAVGVRAVDAALDAFAAAGAPLAGPHRIEHAYLDVDEGRLRRIRALGLVWSVQPGFLGPLGPDWEAGLGRDRMDRMLPIRRGLELGIPILFNSDVPTAPNGPLEGIRAAVTREAGGRRVGVDQAISVADAWRASSTAAAELTLEPRLGALEPGRRADLIVVDGAPFDRNTIDGEVAVAMTMIDGRVAFDRHGLAA